MAEMMKHTLAVVETVSHQFNTMVDQSNHHFIAITTKPQIVGGITRFKSRINNDQTLRNIQFLFMLTRPFYVSRSQGSFIVTLSRSAVKQQASAITAGCDVRYWATYHPYGIASIYKWSSGALFALRSLNMKELASGEVGLACGSGVT